MPTYDYRCEANGQTVEVQHRMSEELRTWGELCEQAGMSPGDTPMESAVTRLATGGNVVTKTRLGSEPSSPPCGAGSCPASGSCPMQ